jgi:hypothetical protein
MNFIFAADVVLSFLFAYYDEDFKIIDDPKVHFYQIIILENCNKILFHLVRI